MLSFLRIKCFKFIALSDINVGNPYLIDRQLDLKRHLLKCLSYERNSIRTVLFLGNLTAHGCANFASDNVIFGNEWKIFLEEWVIPIQNNLDKKKDYIAFCPGSQDVGYNIKFKKNINFEYEKYKMLFGETVSDLLSPNCIFEIDGVLFIRCCIYPTYETRIWLEQVLNEINVVTPIIIFFHEAILSQQEAVRYFNTKPVCFVEHAKEEFYKIIKDHNIIGIINGHKFLSFTGLWKKIPVVCVGAWSCAVCDVDQNNKLTAKFLYSSGNPENKAYSI